MSRSTVSGPRAARLTIAAGGIAGLFGPPAILHVRATVAAVMIVAAGDDQLHDRHGLIARWLAAV